MIQIIINIQGHLSMSSYQKLCTQVYDLTKPCAGADEITFYERFLSHNKGPFLEAMCGSGRLLIPLLERGYSIDGIDNSPYMLESCVQRCAEKKLSARLFNQSLLDLTLPEKYELIFIAVGSFQLLHDQKEAYAVLKKLYDHLLPGGSLLLDTFIPWDSIKDCITHDGILEKQSTKEYRKRIKVSADYHINQTSKITCYAHEQIDECITLYEKVCDDKVLEKEEEHVFIRWYYRYEMELLLQKIGFNQIKSFDVSFDFDQTTVYQAIRD
jgi:SAM-dependent methyltransferase